MQYMGGYGTSSAESLLSQALNAGLRSQESQALRVKCPEPFPTGQTQKELTCPSGKGNWHLPRAVRAVNTRCVSNADVCGENGTNTHTDSYRTKERLGFLKVLTVTSRW